MAARSIGSGTISFGLVAIPIKLYSTVDTTKAIHFNYLAKDGSRLKQQYVRASDGKVVDRDERVQGYEFAKGQYVLFTEDELKAMYVEATNSIDIREFVPLASVDRLYIEKVYYLGPDKGAAKSYHLLRAALEKTGRAALAKYAVRGRSHLVLVRPYAENGHEGLILEQLKSADELRPFAEVELAPCTVSAKELELAEQIIGQRVNDAFEPSAYEDEVRSRMLERIQEKIDGREISMPPEEAPEAKIIDLMEALKASIAGGGRSRGAAGSKPRKPAARAAKKAAETPEVADAPRARASARTAKPAKAAATGRGRTPNAKSR